MSQPGLEQNDRPERPIDRISTRLCSSSGCAHLPSPFIVFLWVALEMPLHMKREMKDHLACLSTKACHVARARGRMRAWPTV